MDEQHAGLEFTGERIVPGQVDPDLLNEHLARYAFACRLARNKRVLDVACGAGYGAAALGETAPSVAAFDVSLDALKAARAAYPGVNVRFLAASAVQMPFRDGSFDLITAFEVIEHLEQWPALLTEARRLLAPGGQFIVSTPNRLYYAESRRLAGPNPYHVHEFDYEAFQAALRDVFPSTAIYLQNHVGAISFHPAAGFRAAVAGLAPGLSQPTPAESHFFIAVCATAPQTGGPLYLYLPSSANVLREREHHILKLEGELAQKDAWLDELQDTHARLQAEHETTLAEMRKQTEWAQSLDAALESASARIVQLQEELEQQQRATTEAVAAYEGQLEGLNRRHQEKLAELAQCVKLLDEAELTVVERTEWAQRLDAKVTVLEEGLAAVRASRWVRFGRRLRVGPDLERR